MKSCYLGVSLLKPITTVFVVTVCRCCYSIQMTLSSIMNPGRIGRPCLKTPCPSSWRSKHSKGFVRPRAGSISLSIKDVGLSALSSRQLASRRKVIFGNFVESLILEDFELYLKEELIANVCDNVRCSGGKFYHLSLSCNRRTYPQ